MSAAKGKRATKALTITSDEQMRKALDGQPNIEKMAAVAEYLEAPLWVLMIPELAKHPDFWERDSLPLAQLQHLVKRFIAADVQKAGGAHRSASPEELARRAATDPAQITARLDKIVRLLTDVDDSLCVVQTALREQGIEVDGAAANVIDNTAVGPLEEARRIATELRDARNEEQRA